MNLENFRANGDFSKSSLSSEGISVEQSDNTEIAKLSGFARAKPRVVLLPSCERPFALRNLPERENTTDSFRGLLNL